MSAFHTILQPNDFSPFARYAFDLACSLAREQQAKVIVLHITCPPPFVLPEGNVTEENFPAYQQKLLEQLRQIKPADAATAVEYRLEVGDPAEVILRVSKEIPCDLIVLGSHGAGWLERLLMGSVAEKVLREATCSVLAVKGRR